MTRNYASPNRGEYVDRGGYTSQDTSHSYSCNWVTRVDVEGRFGYRSPTSHYDPPNQYELVDCSLFQEILLAVMGELDISTRPANLTPKEAIVGVMVQEVEKGLKI